MIKNKLMIDYIKLDISHISAKDLLNHPELKDFWSSNYQVKNTKPIYPVIAKLDNLKFDLKGRDYRELKGSIHKYYNIRNFGSSHNYDSFSSSKLEQCLKDLSERFSLRLDETKIINLEFGVNVNINMSPQEFFATSIITYKNKPISRMKTYGNKGYFTENEMADYSIKIYDKFKQYEECKDGVLRIEIKTKKSRYLRKLGINFLNDLLSKEKLELLCIDLKMRINHLKIIDKISPKTLNVSNKKQQQYLNYRNPKYWENLSYSNRSYHKQQLHSFIGEHDLYNAKLHLTYNVEKELEYLLNN